MEPAVRRLMIATYVGFAMWALFVGTLIGLDVAPVAVLALALAAGLGLNWLVHWRRPWWNVDFEAALRNPAMARRYRRLSIAAFVGGVLLMLATAVIVGDLAAG